jgi:hypothetical protein
MSIPATHESASRFRLFADRIVNFVPAERGTFDFATLCARKFHQWAIKSNKAVTVWTIDPGYEANNFKS